MASTKQDSNQGTESKQGAQSDGNDPDLGLDDIFNIPSLDCGRRDNAGRGKSGEGGQANQG